MAGKKRGEAIDLLAEVNALPAAKRMNWFDSMKPEHREALLKLKAAYKAGKLKHSVSLTHRYCRERLELPVTRSAFAAWLAGD